MYIRRLQLWRGLLTPVNPSHRQLRQQYLPYIPLMKDREKQLEQDQISRTIMERLQRRLVVNASLP